MFSQPNAYVYHPGRYYHLQGLLSVDPDADLNGNVYSLTRYKLSLLYPDLNLHLRPSNGLDLKTVVLIY